MFGVCVIVANDSVVDDSDEACRMFSQNTCSSIRAKYSALFKKKYLHSQSHNLAIPECLWSDNHICNLMVMIVEDCVAWWASPSVVICLHVFVVNFAIAESCDYYDMVIHLYQLMDLVNQ